MSFLGKLATNSCNVLHFPKMLFAICSLLIVKGCKMKLERFARIVLYQDNSQSCERYLGYSVNVSNMFYSLYGSVVWSVHCFGLN